MLVALQCVPGLDTFVCIPTVPQNYGTAVVRWVKSSARPPPLAVWFVQFEAMRRGLFSLSMKIMGGGVVSACCWEHTGATFDHTVHINTRDVCRFCGPSVTGLACGDAFAGTPRTSLFAGLCCALHEQCCNARRHADKE